MASSAPLVSNVCAGWMPRKSATSFSPGSRGGYSAMVLGSSDTLRILASTRGEQPLVFSFRSKRKSIVGLLSGDRYSRISRTLLRALSMGTPGANGFSMSFQAFRFRERDHRRRDRLQAVAGEL